MTDTTPTPAAPITQEGVGTSRLPANLHSEGFSTSGTALKSIGTYSNEVTIPGSSLLGGLYHIPAHGSESNLALSFVGSDAAGEAATGRLWAFKPVNGVVAPSGGDRQRRVQEYLAVYLGDLAITLGTAAKDASSQIFPAANILFADTLAMSPDLTLSPGARQVGGQALNGLGFLLLDKMGFGDFILNVDVGTMASLSPIWWEL